MCLSGPRHPQLPRLRVSYAADTVRAARREVRAHNSAVQYEARNFGDNSASRGVYRYVLGVVDRTLHKIDMYDADGVYGLQQVRVTGRNATIVAVGGLDGVTDQGRRDILISAFGSRKKQKMDASTKSNIVNVKAVAAAADVALSLRTVSAAVAAAAADAASDSEDAGEVVAAAVGSTTQIKVDASLAASRSAKLPPFNATTRHPARAYPLRGLLPRAWMDAMASEIDAISAACNASTSKAESVLQQGSDEGTAAAMRRSASRHSEFVQSRLERLSSLSSGSAASAAAGDVANDDSTDAAASRRTTVALLLRVAQLLSLHNAATRLTFRSPPAGLTDGEAAADSTGPYIPALRGVPREAVDDLLQNFCEKQDLDASSVFVRTPDLQDRLTAHVAALSLHVDEAWTQPGSDVSALARDMRLSPAKLASLFRELGCVTTPIRAGDAEPHDPLDGKVTEAGSGRGAGISGYRVYLKAPLVFPKPKMGRRK